MTVGGRDFYVDLVCFHRGLKRLVVLDLKLGHFIREYKGQMEFYLRWLDKYDWKPWKDSSTGLILFSGKDEGQIELLQLDHVKIRVAEYLRELPLQPLLQAKLRQAMQIVRERLIKN